ncbi:MalY/PatB family protein [Streptomyces sp. NPDC052043]|uniref:MalY/PatB family protein n=1 Tax=Streptomyces sp. NPDC052043 TaxID=3365684 RepID=UPI0037D337C2
MPTVAQLDAITEAHLRAVGGEKWSTFPGAIGAFVAEMDFGIAEPVHDALRSAVDQGAVGYMSPSVSRASSVAAAAWLARSFDWRVDPSHVRPVADVIECYTLAIEHYSPPGSPIVVPTPAYTPFLKVAAAKGRRIIEVPLIHSADRWRLDLEAIGKALEERAGLVVLCNPHNPTGAVAEADELRALAEVVQKRGSRVFADEIHAPLTYGGRRHVPYALVSAEAAAHTVTAISASKAWNLAGLKCAHMVLSNAADLRTWHDRCPRAELGAGTLGAVAATAAYRHGQPWLDDIVAYLSNSRLLVADLIRQHLPQAQFQVPEATYFAWIDCRKLGIRANPRDFFLEHAQVACTDGTAFGHAGAGHVRLNFATPRPVLETAISRMGAAVAGST